MWYHFDCLGLSYPEAVQIGASQDAFVCPHCTRCSFTDNVQDPSETSPSLESVYTPYNDFQRGDVNGEFFCNFLMSAYEKIVHWKPNVFLIPFGRAGKRFVRDCISVLQIILLSIPFP